MLALAAVVLSAAVAGSAQAQRSPQSSLHVAAELAGTRLIDGEETPVKVVATEPTRIKMVATNRGGEPQEITGLRFEGKVVGVPVFRCDVLAPAIVPPGETVERTFEIEAACLRDQATGLVPASLTVHGPGREPIARWAIVLDIKGSLKTIYGLTGLFVVMITVLALGGLLAALLRQRLPRNRFSRALRFTTVGIGIGFSLVFVLASTAVMVPDAENWIPVVVVPAVVFTIGGYLSPSPQREPRIAPETAEATQVMPQTVGGAEATAQVSSAVPTYPGPAQAGAGRVAAPGAPTVGHPAATASPSQTPPSPLPTKKVRPVSSADAAPAGEDTEER